MFLSSVNLFLIKKTAIRLFAERKPDNNVLSIVNQNLVFSPDGYYSVIG